MTDVTETVKDTVEEMGIDALIERQEAQGIKLPWENWVAFSSSVLAVLSALGALYATFSIDEATLVISNEAVYVAYREGAAANFAVTKAKVEILAALGKPVNNEDLKQIKKYKQQFTELNQKVKDADNEGMHKFKVHDRLAISVTLFQVAILLGGLSVIVRRRSIWIFGMTFAFAAFALLSWGLITF